MTDEPISGNDEYTSFAIYTRANRGAPIQRAIIYPPQRASYRDIFNDCRNENLLQPIEKKIFWLCFAIVARIRLKQSDKL